MGVADFSRLRGTTLAFEGGVVLMVEEYNLSARACRNISQRH